MNFLLRRFESAVPNLYLRRFLMVLSALFCLELATGYISFLAGVRPAKQVRSQVSATRAQSEDADEDIPSEPFPPHASAKYLVSLPPDSFTSELVIQAPYEPGIYNLIKVENWFTREPLMFVYCEPTRQVRMRLPPSKYRIKVARGKVWQGDKLLFGPDTRAYATGSPVDLTEKRDGSVPTTRLAIQGLVDGSARGLGLRKEQF